MYYEPTWCFSFRLYTSCTSIRWLEGFVSKFNPRSQREYKYDQKTPIYTISSLKLHIITILWFCTIPNNINTWVWDKKSKKSELICLNDFIFGEALCKSQTTDLEEYRQGVLFFVYIHNLAYQFAGLKGLMGMIDYYPIFRNAKYLSAKSCKVTSFWENLSQSISEIRSSIILWSESVADM